jgi:hypothetical protein
MDCFNITCKYDANQGRSKGCASGAVALGASRQGGAKMVKNNIIVCKMAKINTLRGAKASKYCNICVVYKNN